MPWTTTDLANIEAAIAKGELTIHFQDRSVTYRSVKELMEARGAILSELQAGTQKPPRQVRMGTSNGWGSGFCR